MGYYISNYKKFLLLVVLIFTHNINAFAQTGFSNSYAINARIDFHKVVYANDKINIAAVGVIPSLQRARSQFIVTDTFGTVEQIIILQNDDSWNNTMDMRHDLIQTSDSGFLLTHGLFELNSSELVKLSKNLEIVWKTKFDLTPKSNFPTIARHILEIDSGYIIAGHYQADNATQGDAFVFRISDDGDIVWNRKFGNPIWYDFNNSIVQRSDGKIFIGGIKMTNPFVQNQEDVMFQSLIYQITVTGQLNKVWNSVTNSNLNGHFSMVSSDVNGLIVLIAPQEYNEQFNNYFSNGGLVKFDSDFNIIWEKEFGEKSSSFNRTIELIHTMDDNLVFCGRMYGEGWVVKTDMEGNLIWDLRASYDNTVGHDTIHNKNYLSGITELPSGNLIAVGGNEVFGDTLAYYGWMLKITPDGCIDTICLTTSDDTQIIDLSQKDIVMYPNPSNGIIHINGIDNLIDQGEELRLFIHSANGQIIKQEQLTSSQFNLDQKGLFFVQIIDEEGERIIEGKVVVQ